MQSASSKTMTVTILDKTNPVIILGHPTSSNLTITDIMTQAMQQIRWEEYLPLVPTLTQTKE